MGTTDPQRTERDAPTAGDPAEEDANVEQLIETRLDEVRRQLREDEYVVDRDAVAAAIVARLRRRRAPGASPAPRGRVPATSPGRRRSRTGPQSSCA